MTNDKELIERLAIECANDTILHIRQGNLSNSYQLINFATDLIARYLAERGTKSSSVTSECREQFESWLSDLDPRPFRPDAYNDQVYKWKGWKAAWNHLASQQPAIPEGWIPRNPEPYLICGDVAVSNDPRYAGWVFVRHSNGKDWTTGAKLTPETWSMIAAAGVKP